MTVRELLRNTNFEEIFNSLKEDFYILYNVLPEDMKKSEMFARKYYEKAYNNFLALNGNDNSDDVIVVAKLIDDLTESEEERFFVYNYNKKELNNYINKKSNTLSSYDLKFLDWNKIFNIDVWEKSLEKYGSAIVSAAIIHEFTFFGCEYEKVKYEVNKETEFLKQQVKEIKNGTAELYSLENVQKGLEVEFDFETEELTDEEMEIKCANIERIMEINKKRKNEILGRIN